MSSFFFKCFNDFTALLLSTMMKARSLVYLTTFENETTFNFSGKTALEIFMSFAWSCAADGEPDILLRYSKSKVELMPNLSEFSGFSFQVDSE